MPFFKIAKEKAIKEKILKEKINFVKMLGNKNIF